MSKFLFASLALFAGSLAAQATITTVIHEPSAADAGPTLGAATVVNPDYNPLQPNGQPQFLPLIGNGSGISNELDSISDEFYALGGTTTHDLAIMTNNTGADITVDPTTLVVAQIRPKVSPPGAPEQANPGLLVQNVYGFSNAQFTIANGASGVLLLLVTKWMGSLDTSPRDYIITFQFNNTAPGGGPITIDAPLTVPKVGGNNSSGGCTVATSGGMPRGAAILAGASAVAILTRRRIFKRA
ncbi:MAG: hypothetical protein KF754_08045 [Planctomycetes bacterium]|nr:hypothetical protein [Planctomycetota bacterium]